jgi:hypothetical protein
MSTSNYYLEKWSLPNISSRPTRTERHGELPEQQHPIAIRGKIFVQSN